MTKLVNNGVAAKQAWRATLRCSPVQARLALNSSGLRDQIEAVIESGGRDAKDIWEFAGSVERLSPLIDLLKDRANLTDEQIDELFVQAMRISF